MKQVILLSADGLQKEVSVDNAIRTWVNPIARQVSAIAFKELSLDDFPTRPHVIKREYKFRGRRLEGKEIFEEVL